MKSVLVFLLLTGSTVGVLGQMGAPHLTSATLWKPEHVPFSFKYGGKDSARLLTTWQTSDESVAGVRGQIHRYSYTDPATRLKITAEVRLYSDFPGAIDWVLKFRNDGPSDTPVLENILPLNWAITPSSGDCFIRHAQGSDASGPAFTYPAWVQFRRQARWGAWSSQRGYSIAPAPGRRGSV